MNEAIDYSALNWVREELNETLNRACRLLEEFSENPETADYLQGCKAHLHQACGTLQMVELQGVDLLSREMEAVVDALLEGRAEQPDDAMEVLMRAFIQLPDYLSRLRSGRPEVPVVLLPVINELRATYGAEPLSASVLFSFDLAVPMPAGYFNSQVDIDSSDAQAVAGSQRHRFQAGLLEWYRGDNSGGLQKLHEVLDGLQRASRQEASARLWWLGAAVIEALQAGMLQGSIRSKQLFGQVERQIKHLIDAGEPSFAGSVPEDLLKSLLYLVSQAEGNSGRIGEIKQVYDLAQAGISTAHDWIAGCGQEVFGSVSAAAGENLEDLKERLDIFMRGGMKQVADLASIAADMHVLGNTISMIGLDEAAGMLAESAKSLRAMSETNQSIDESGMLVVANTLVTVEEALNGICAGEDSLTQRLSVDNFVYRQGQEAVIREAVADLVQSGEWISEYMNAPGDREKLRQVPAVLDQVRGGLQLVGQEQAAAMVAKVCGYINEVLNQDENQPEELQLDALADAICSLEYYVGELEQNRNYGGMVLDIAEQSLGKLQNQENTSGVMSAGELGQAITDTTSMPAEISAITGLQVIAADLDEEIRPIYEEEVAEEQNRLAGLIPRWVSDPGDRESLESICRSFHTLKGGGRMVGAQVLGEFSWAFESLLNRVAGGTTAADREIQELLVKAPAAVSQLLEQITTGRIPELDIDGMVGRAMELSSGATQPSQQVPQDVATQVGNILTDAPVVDEQQPAHAAADVTAAEVTEAADSCHLPVLSDESDPEIVEIFLEEAAEVLEVVFDLLPKWIANPADKALLGEVRRSFHTLKGSGRMAGALLAGEFAWCIENLLNRVIDDSIETSDALFTMLDLVPRSMSELIRQINNGPEPESDFRALMDQAEKLARGESVAVVMQTGDTSVFPGEQDADSTTGVAQTQADAEPKPEIEADEPQANETGVFIPEPQSDTDDTDLMEIFGRECREHLNAIQSFIDECEASEDPCLVSERLYRALHTLSGIAESADVVSIHTLASHLYTSFSVLQESQQAVPPDALQALTLCKDAISGLVDSMPDISCESGWLHNLQMRIDEAFQDQPQPEQMLGISSQASEETPVMEVVGQHGEPSQEVKDQVDRPAIDMQPETDFTVDPGGPDAAEDPYADMDPELFEVFLEEADEIIEGSEITLHSWSVEPQRRDLAEAFQRQLHTLKGGARMVGIDAIGDLSHSMETLLTRIVDGQVELSQRLFELLHEAHDRLAEMLGRVRAREAVETAVRLEGELGSVVSDAGSDTGIDEAEPVGTESEIVPDGDHVDECVEAVSVSEAVEQIVVQEEADTHATMDGEDSEHRETDAAPGVLEQEIEPEEAGAEAEAPELASEREEVGSYPVVTEPVLAQAQENVGMAADAVEQVVAQAVQAAAVREGEVKQHKAERRQPSRVRGEQVRVHSELLDSLVNYAGEINIYRSRLDQQIGAYRFNLAELDQTIMRLRDQLRQLEIETETQILYRHEQEGLDRNPTFDPLEMDRYSNLQQLSRSLMESISDLHSIQDLLYNATRESETLILQQSRVCTDLQEGLMRTRMIPFAGLAPRLRRVVRQAAQELGKKVDLKMDGAEGEMDRTVVENIIAPLEHMLRNAVDHGIEDPKQRTEAGKPEIGTINITFHREGPEIVLRIADDGRGINHDAVRRRAAERGIIADDAELSDSDILHFLLQAGFSTASEVTQISGRGVGMDVVNSEVKQLGGSLHIDTTPGQGSVFTIRLPYTLAINQALMVKAGKDTFCVPLGTIEGVVRIPREDLVRYYQAAGAVYEYAGNSYRLQHLGTLLNRGGMDQDNTPGRLPVLLVRIGEMRAALQVEALIGHREIVVKPLGAQLSRVNGVSGATILGDGRVVMILDLAAILRMGGRVQPPGEGRQYREKLVVMVVDDSITVRKVTTRLLERHGYIVITAKDGVDALGLLEDTVPDMMLLDIEMPRMDGFELATHIRNDERLRHIPVTMITSRTGDKHRERANQIGIEHYLGKPYQEHELLNKIQRLIGIPEAG